MRRRRRKNPSGVLIGAGLVAAVGVGLFVLSRRAQPGDLVTVPFKALDVPDLVPVTLLPNGVDAKLRVTRSLPGGKLAGKPDGMLDSAPEVTFARSAVIAIEQKTHGVGRVFGLLSA